MYRALKGKSRSPTGEECFVARQVGEMFRRLARKGKGGDPILGVFRRVVVGISQGELRAKVLNFLLGQFQGALGLFVFLLFPGEYFCAFCTP